MKYCIKLVSAVTLFLTSFTPGVIRSMETPEVKSQEVSQNQDKAYLTNQLTKTRAGQIQIVAYVTDKSGNKKEIIVRNQGEVQELGPISSIAAVEVARFSDHPVFGRYSPTINVWEKFIRKSDNITKDLLDHYKESNDVYIEVSWKDPNSYSTFDWQYKFIVGKA
ncbi:hypothetical protein H0X06_05380 [Candidatus Dependentiae bacterium]|nr:hypothetical protein [Candidatus Dependentiae bacterium]